MKSTDKYNKIIHAAAKVFAKKGFFNARISDIAKEAKVADGTIYLYFSNKFNILLSVFEQEIGKQIEEVNALLLEEEDVQEKLNIFIRHHLEAMRKNRALAEVIYVELRQTNKLIREYRSNKFSEYLDVVANIITLGQEQGIYRQNIDISLVKSAIFGALDETSPIWLVGANSSTQTAEQFSLFFQNALLQ